jgi:hypothetical protein
MSELALRKVVEVHRLNRAKFDLTEQEPRHPRFRPKF